jgi:hypothetical protein
MKIDNPLPDYSAARGAVKSVGHGLLGALSALLVGAIPWIPAEHKTAAAGVVFCGLEFLRNALKVKMPGVFFWL